jgi:hypothetical protein
MFSGPKERPGFFQAGAGIIETNDLTVIIDRVCLGIQSSCSAKVHDVAMTIPQTGMPFKVFRKAAPPYSIPLLVDAESFASIAAESSQFVHTLLVPQNRMEIVVGDAGGSDRVSLFVDAPCPTPNALVWIKVRDTV